MFREIKTLASLVVFIAEAPLESHRFNKKQKAHRKEQEAYDAMIAESQAKIGPYKPATIPVQVWA